MKYVYIVKLGTKHSGIITNLRIARRVSKSNPGSTIWRVNYQYFKDCGGCMDVPTFCMVGDRIN